MSSQQKPTLGELGSSMFTNFVLLCIMIWLFFYHVDKLIPVWRAIRLTELTAWNAIFSLVGVEYFDHFLSQLKRTPAARIRWHYVAAFEADLNHYLRFVYASIVGYFAFRSFKNHKRVAGQYTVQSMVEAYAHVNESLATLAVDNPLNYSMVYDFSNRSDYHNRHAMSIGPQQFLTAVPPPNASYRELREYERAEQEERPHQYRPIAIIKRDLGELNFSTTLARTALERQLTKIPSESLYYIDEINAPRLFDDEGYVIPFEYDDEGVVIGGFSRGGLLNNGHDFAGDACDIRWLFCGTERKIYDLLCARYRGPHVSIEVLTTELLKRHAFSRTFLVSLLNYVRENELIASTEFYMTCREDRGLFFSLYSAGEEKPYYEAMGVMAHYHMEVLLGRKLTTPWVLTAVRCLERDAKRIANAKPVENHAIKELTQELVSDSDIALGALDSSLKDEELLSQIAAFADSLEDEIDDEHV